MTIQSDDIKLLRSAVMADVPEGGGPITGVEIVDGQSNNIFPDISSDDRAAGRVNFRKVAGQALTDSTDLLLGSSFAVMDPPEDPNVHVTLFETAGWADTLEVARQKVEQYLVKGAKLLSRIQDVHYQGALLLQLYNIAPATSFPASGDTIVVRNPSGQEQYLRVNKAQTSSIVAFIGGSQQTVNLCSCELTEALEFDVLGKPVQMDDPPASNTAVVYSTTPAVGAQFYGVKPLAAPALIGDRSVTAEDGIFTPLVPAATVEDPVIDVYPLVPRPTLARTASAAVTLPGVSLTLTAGTVLQLPTAIEPASLTMTHGAASFTSNAAGDLLQGTTVVGSVDWRNLRVVMSGSAPSYGASTNTITYKPATVTGALAYSDAVEITTNNQGLAFVFAFDPPPAPGTMVLSYMAQGRWYDLVEDGTGKLSGADSSYGTGTLSFLTGSLAVTLGAVPDVGSSIIVLWGDTNTAKTAVGTLPTRAYMDFELEDAPRPGTLSFAWSRGGTNYTATVAASGAVTGPANVDRVVRRDDGVWTVRFYPHTLPDGAVSLTYQRLPESANYTGSGGSYTLTDAPMRAGSLRFKAIATAAGHPNRVVEIWADASGTVWCEGSAIGTLNAATGALSLSSPTFSVRRWATVKRRVATDLAGNPLP